MLIIEKIALLLNRIFIKPGPAEFTSSKSFMFFNNKSLIFSDNSLGFNLFSFAKIKLIFVDKSQSKFERMKLCQKLAFSP